MTHPDNPVQRAAGPPGKTSLHHRKRVTIRRFGHITSTLDILHYNPSTTVPASNHHLNLLLAKLIIYLPLIAFIPTIRLRTQTRIAPRTEHHTIPIVRIDTLRISIRPTFMAIYRRLPLLDR